MPCYKKATKINGKTNYFSEKQSFSCKQEFTNFLKELPIGVLLTDTNQKIVYCNPAFSSILGFENEDIFNYDISGIFSCSPQHMNSTKKIMGHSTCSFSDVFVCNWNTKMGIEKQLRCKKIDLFFAEESFSGTAWFLEDLSFSFDIKETFSQTKDDEESKTIVRKKLELERAISFISSSLVAPENLDNTLTNSLKIAGEICGASRAYLFRLHEDNKNMSNTHEWCAAEIESQKENLQDLPVDMFPWWMEKVNLGEIIHIKDVSSMPLEAAAEKEILEMQDITSLLVLPVYISRKIAGFIGLDNVAETTKWSMEDVVVLGAVANIMGSAIGQKEIQDELNERNRKLEKAYNELKKIEIMKDEFISNLSHELRTPLNSIQGYSELLIEDEMELSNPKHRKAINAVFRSSKRLGSLINSLLYMGSVLAGKLDYQFDPIQIENVIDNAVSQYAYQAQKKDIQIKKEIAGRIPVINGDVNFLPQLLYKLLDNAIKFTPESGTITISVNEINGGVHIKVIDTGIGIPEEKIDDIFTSFYQVDGSSTRNYGGTGIGLHIAKKIVTAHNGRIWIDNNNEKEGAVVHVFLPPNKATYYH